MGKKIYFAMMSLALIVVVGIYLSLASLIYGSSIRNEEEKIKYFITGITKYFAASVDRDELAYLIDRVDPNITEEERDLIERSPQFQSMLKQLKLISDSFSKYCTFLYIIYPLDEQTYFIIGADYFEIKNIDKFSDPFDASPFPYMQQALAERRTVTEPDITFDPDYNIYSISAYAPIFSDARFLGVVGLDLEKSDYDRLRYSYAIIAGVISFLGLSSMVITALFVSEKISLYKGK